MDIRILGTFDVLIDGDPVALGGPQRMAILVVLLLHQGEVLNSDQLIEHVWGGSPPKSALSALHAHVSRLRKALNGADILQSHGSGYRVAVEPDMVDAFRFERLVEQGGRALAQRDWAAAVALYSQGLGLWRGPALTEFATEPWAQCDAIRLEELRFSAEEGRTDAELALGRHAEALPRLEQRVSEHPLRERSVAQLMRSLYRCGRQGDALNVYERVRRILAEELGVDPAPALQATHQAILRHDPGLDGSPAPPARQDAPPRRIVNLPSRNQVFSGRETILEEIEAALTEPTTRPPPRVVALHGLGGTGKTQAAVEYAHRHAADYDVVWEASAVEPVAFWSVLAELALRLGVRQQADRGEILAALGERLAGMERWLLILDDVEDGTLIEAFLSSLRAGHVIVTSRNPAWGQLAVGIRVGPFSRSESVDFLSKRVARTSGAWALADQLGDLPFALEQAAAYSEQTGMKLDEYGDLFRRRADQLLTRDKAFATVWQLAFERVAQASPVAIELLHLCATLGPGGVSLDLLHSMPGVLPPALRDAVEDELALQDAIAHLLRHSLVERDRGRLRMHPLVKAAVWARLPGEERRTWVTCAVGILSSVVPADAENPTTWRTWDSVIPDVIHLGQEAGSAGLVVPGLARMLCGSGHYLTIRAAFERAQELFELALRLVRRQPGADGDLAAVLSDHGNLLELTGDINGARAAQEQALVLAERAMGGDHPAVARVLQRLGAVLVCQRRLPEARRTLERALAILTAWHEPDRREIARVSRDLGFAAWTAGDLRAAQEWLTRALATARTILGPDHPDVAHTLSGLGLVVQDTGRPQRAVKLQEQAASMLAAVYGDEHPDVAHTLDKLGYALRLTGRFEEARISHERALSILEFCYGPGHGEVGMPLTNLGLVDLDTGEPKLARDHQERAIQVFRNAYGDDHAHVHLGVRRLGQALLADGRAAEARDLLRSALAGTERVLGNGHPDVAYTLLDLAEAYERLEEQESADDCRSRAERILARGRSPIQG
ncbi:FxSxx-COOH system tetratricopeptide repeat protein [Nonomuraea guangzhouensis]|uniref:FxSxx-COOH system tetratricopeptide repeat protein n=1 Tax=Nonomuraea guangzhouensis TaxID=1291555 RepID=A0ABW4GZX8_9ACTN|nr:FxSxx-COOH system tetratricopeptide repeat protein [Nonomuraea guangzhouensis]